MITADFQSDLWRWELRKEAGEGAWSFAISSRDQMRNETRAAYDALASEYQLIYFDWDKSVRWQAKILDGIIRKHLRFQNELSLLDCSCGIGTQAIGLALRGYKVYASDLSPKSIEEARRNAEKAKAKLNFGVADFRELTQKVKGRFDVVLSCDNSLPHMLTEKDILRVAKNMKAKMNPRGIGVLGIRDYDDVLARRPTGLLPVRMKDRKGERIYVQSWLWDKRKPIYQFQLFLLTKIGTQWKTQGVTAKYRAWSRKELSALFRRAGFSSVRWFLPKESGFKQPLAIFKN